MRRLSGNQQVNVAAMILVVGQTFVHLRPGERRKTVVVRVSTVSAFWSRPMTSCTAILVPLGSTLSESRFPEFVENPKKFRNPKEPLENAVLRPRQMRYQAALRLNPGCLLSHGASVWVP